MNQLLQQRTTGDGEQEKTMQGAITMAAANAPPNPPSVWSPWKPTNVANSTSGVDSAIPFAIPSTKTRRGRIPHLSTAAISSNGIAVCMPPSDHVSTTRLRTKRLIGDGVFAVAGANDAGIGTSRKTAYRAYPRYERTKSMPADIYSRRAMNMEMTTYKPREMKLDKVRHCLPVYP